MTKKQLLKNIESTLESLYAERGFCTIGTQEYKEFSVLISARLKEVKQLRNELK